ncbi:MAG: hypothetical protein V2A70_01685, partial [Candidatus Omnitrophota bacterium]
MNWSDFIQKSYVLYRQKGLLKYLHKSINFKENGIFTLYNFDCLYPEKTLKIKQRKAFGKKNRVL